MTPEEVAGSRAVLVGVHDYQSLGTLDGVRHNVPALRALLTDDDVGGLTDAQCIEVPSDSKPDAILDAVHNAAKEAKHLLIVYYAGHGHFDRDGRSLLLGTRDSDLQRPYHSVAYDEIRTAVANSGALHRVIIIDCCFSGRALQMDGKASATDTRNFKDRFKVPGACVLTSAAETERSLCLPEGSVFTLELIRLLQEGLGGDLPDGRRGEHLITLTMADVYEILCSRLKDHEVEGLHVPQPQMSTHNNGHLIPLARNRAFIGERIDIRAVRSPHTAYAPSPYFTGRDEEITHLERMATSPPSIALIYGYGGRGKTELLRATAARVAHLFPGGCLEVDLRGWTTGGQRRDPHMVIAEQLQHMGYKPEQIPHDRTARAETWRLFLANHALLLVLDNAYDAEQLAPLMPGAGSRSMIVISSRSELPELPVDWRHALAAMPNDDCIAAWHKMGVPEDTPHLGELAERINGSPLALGPLSTRLMHGASSEAVLASLSGTHRYRNFQDIDAAERAIFNSAYDVLDDCSRALIRHGAWHPGPDFGPDSLAMMAQLREHEVEIRLAEIGQLLIRNNGRYSFHDLSLDYARQLAAQDLSEGEAEASRERLYAYLYSHLRKSRRNIQYDAYGNDQEIHKARRWLDQHAQELESVVRAANQDGWSRTSDFLLELGNSLSLDNRYVEAEALFQLLLPTVDPESQHYADCTAGLGDVYRAQGRYHEAAVAYQRAHDVYRNLGKRHGQANAIISQGNTYYMQNRYREAADSYNRALALYRNPEDDPHGQARALKSLGDVYRAQSRYDEADATYRRALGIYQSLGDRLGQANAIRGLGNVRLMQGQYKEAAVAHQESHAIYQSLGNRLGQANATRSLGNVHRKQNKYDEAIDAYQQALDLYRILGDRVGQAGSLYLIAEIDSRRDPRKAAKGFRAARDIYIEFGMEEWAEKCQQKIDDLESGA